jgi:nucleoside-diphosphate kinase
MLIKCDIDFYLTILSLMGIRYTVILSVQFIPFKKLAMTLERTLSIIKPDAVGKQLIGAILQRFENAHFRIVAAKMLKMTKEQAEEFYEEHEGREFYLPLIEFMSSGPIMALVLEGDDIISAYRELIGNTDPTQAALGTIRADFAETTRYNAVHGSDSPASASREIAFFFADDEIHSLTDS